MSLQLLFFAVDQNQNGNINWVHKSFEIEIKGNENAQKISKSMDEKYNTTQLKWAKCKDKWTIYMITIIWYRNYGP